MRILITGATGFIGLPLVTKLISGQAEVYGLALEEDIASCEQDSDTNSRVTLLPADLRDTTATAGVVARVQPHRIVHLAAAGVANPAIESRLALEHNVHGTLNLIHAAFQNRAVAEAPRQMIVVRTPGESHPTNAYTASKAAAWSFCQMYATRYEWPIVGAMIFQAYGPRQAPHTFVQAALRAAVAGGDFAMTSGGQLRDWIYVQDVVEGLIAAVASELEPGTSFDLGTGRLTSLIDVANLAYQLVGRGGKPFPGGLTDRPGEAFAQVADVERSTNLLNWAPQIELSMGLELLIGQLAQ